MLYFGLGFATGAVVYAFGVPIVVSTASAVKAWIATKL